MQGAGNMNVFLTADHHFNSDKIRKFWYRPFKNVEEMNEVMIERWNSVVREGDTVFHLGDFAEGWNWKSIAEIGDRLNGSIIIILGNHDNKRRLLKAGFSLADSYIVKINKLLLTHFPMREIRNNGSVNVHGHIHSRRTRGRRINVSVENTNYTPVLLEDVLSVANKLLKVEW